MEEKKRTASEAIMEFINWIEGDNPIINDYERGIMFGLMIAQQIAEEVEHNA